MDTGNDVPGLGGTKCDPVPWLSSVAQKRRCHPGSGLLQVSPGQGVFPLD
jgi:hypothetical protein